MARKKITIHHIKQEIIILSVTSKNFLLLPFHLFQIVVTMIFFIPSFDHHTFISRSGALKQFLNFRSQLMSDQKMELLTVLPQTILRVSNDWWPWRGVIEMQMGMESNLTLLRFCPFWNAVMPRRWGKSGRSPHLFFPIPPPFRSYSKMFSMRSCCDEDVGISFHRIVTNNSGGICPMYSRSIFG